MAEDKKQPMIPVKKADGTTVKMTMAEFRLYKEQGAKSKEQVASAKQITDDVEKIDDQKIRRSEDHDDKNLPMVEGETHLSSTAPVKEIFVDEAVNNAKLKMQNAKLQNDSVKKTPAVSAPIREYVKKEEEAVAKDWQAEDSQSLLEGAPVELQREATVMAPELTLADLESKVLKKLNFSVASDLRGRVLSLITSRMKNIRTDEQFMDYAGREAEIGGLGLDESQTKELLDTAKKELSIPDMVRMGSRRQMRQEMAEKKNAPIVEPAPQKAPEEPRKPEVRRPIPIMPPAEPKIRMIEKPILHDVVLPHTNLDNDMSLGDSEHDLTTGPVDEIRDFSIIDFRRLASSPVKARELLLNKFRMLKKESYLYLIKAKIAWKDSPMYKGYLQVLAQALSDQKTIEQVLTSMESEESLTKEEFDSVVFVNSHIV